MTKPDPADTRQCTCYPDDNPPQPCARKYALSECRAAASPTAAGGDVLAVQAEPPTLEDAYADGRKDEHADCVELIAWAYDKLHRMNFQRMEDALMLDRMKLLLEHGIHA